MNIRERLIDMGITVSSPPLDSVFMWPCIVLIMMGIGLFLFILIKGHFDEKNINKHLDRDQKNINNPLNTLKNRLETINKMFEGNLKVSLICHDDDLFQGQALGITVVVIKNSIEIDYFMMTFTKTTLVDSLNNKGFFMGNKKNHGFKMARMIEDAFDMINEEVHHYFLKSCD